MNTKLRSRILLSLRIFVGLVFLLSGVGKLINSDDAKYLVELMGMEIYWIIEFKTLIVYSITILELVIAVLLLWGRHIRIAFVTSFFLLLFMTSILLYFQFQDMNVESCGCFGAFDILSGPVATISKNVVLLLCSMAGFILIPETNSGSMDES